jgi:hypothetical protein
VEDRKVPDAAWLRLAEIARGWPETSEARKALRDFLIGHRGASAQMLRFFAHLESAELQPIFWDIIAQGTQAPKIVAPDRVAAAVSGLCGTMSDDKVPRVAELLGERNPHMVRAAAADALGAIANRAGISALIGQVRDAAIGERARASLYRLTGQDYGFDSAAWETWSKESGAGAELRMLSREDWLNHARTTPLPARPTAPPPSMEFHSSAECAVRPRL